MAPYKDRDNKTVKKIAIDTVHYLLNHPNIKRKKVTNLKGKIAKKHDYNKVIKNATILKYADELELEKDEKKLINKLLRRRSTRSISGVSVIAIMTKPVKCPGECIYCPGESSQPGEKVAQSYTGQEPAAMRSIHYKYDPFLQVRSRIEDLEAIGHKVDKIELIIMGGTFLAADENYQREFMKGALEGIINKRVDSLEEAKKLAEISDKRVIGITFETRPDFCKKEDVDRMLSYGATRVEIGIQTVYDDIFNTVNRGHSTKDTIKAIQIAKDAGLKINGHIMPNLPGSSYERDLEMFDILFENPDYRPDMLKIYPCLVIKGTELYDWWQRGKYSPYSEEKLVQLLSEVKATKIPRYVRIQRVMRDIPAPLIEAGCQKSNLRQIVRQYMKKRNLKCNCIRCREYGIKKRGDDLSENDFDQIKIHRIDYDASNGKEIFLSLENKKKNHLFGYLRLRKPSRQSHRTELNDEKTMIVREIKVVGELVPRNLDPSNRKQIQHRGFGSCLLGIAEKISREEFNAKKLAVIAGLGVRTWFYDLGYELDEPYVVKIL
jgi:elongator complex protein 3